MNTLSTLSEKITDALRESIISGELQPGSRLHEIELAEKYRTSRTPVREALRQLEAEGFISIRPRRGAVVSEITEKDIIEFYQIKAVLEGYAAESAAAKLTESDLQKMEELNNKIENCYRAEDVNGIITAHNEFHEVFVRAAGNDRLYQIIKNLVSQFKRFRIALSYTQAVEESIAEHREIIAAFRSKDLKLASQTVRKNASSGSESLVKRLRAIKIGQVNPHHPEAQKVTTLDPAAPQVAHLERVV